MVQPTDLVYAYTRNDYEESVRAGEEYLRGICGIKTDTKKYIELSASPLLWNTPSSQWEAHVILADAYRHLEQPECSYTRLKDIVWQETGPTQVDGALNVIARLYQYPSLDLSELIVNFWQGICEEKPNARKVSERKDTFLRLGKTFFTKKMELALCREGSGRTAWGFFLPLRGICTLGDIAALMSSETSDEADRLLVSFDDLTELPVSAFIHALKLGAVFPLPGTVLSVEQARIFATALKADMPFLRDAAIYASFAAESDQDILWAHALACASLQSSDWEKKRDKELLYAFVRTESRFLTHCYSVYALNHPAYLGAQQRFALHLVNTFAVLHPSLVDAAFTPFTKTDVHFALSELRLAAYDFPQCKAVVEAVLDDLTAE